MARWALARRQPAKRQGQGQGHGKHRSKSSHDLSFPGRNFPTSPSPHPFTTSHTHTHYTSNFSRLPSLQHSALYEPPLNIVTIPRKHQLSSWPRAFFFRTVSSPSRCLSSPLSPWRFSPASSLPRPISPSLPHPSIPLFEVSSPVF